MLVNYNKILIDPDTNPRRERERKTQVELHLSSLRAHWPKPHIARRAYVWASRTSLKLRWEICKAMTIPRLYCLIHPLGTFSCNICVRDLRTKYYTDLGSLSDHAWFPVTEVRMYAYTSTTTTTDLIWKAHRTYEKYEDRPTAMISKSRTTTDTIDDRARFIARHLRRHVGRLTLEQSSKASRLDIRK